MYVHDPKTWEVKAGGLQIEASLRCVVKPYLTSYSIPQIMKEVVTVQKKSYFLRF